MLKRKFAHVQDKQPHPLHLYFHTYPHAHTHSLFQVNTSSIANTCLWLHPAYILSPSVCVCVKKIVNSNNYKSVCVCVGVCVYIHVVCTWNNNISLWIVSTPLPRLLLFLWLSLSLPASPCLLFLSAAIKLRKCFLNP